MTEPRPAPTATTTTSEAPPSPLVSAWTRELSEVCVTEADRATLRNALAAFADVTERLEESGEREAWPSWYMLGRALADDDVSLRLVCEAPAKLAHVFEAAMLGPSRAQFNVQIALASLVEGYVRAQEDVRERKRAMHDDCAPFVCVHEGAAVVLAHAAIEDEELRSEFADRLASYVAKRGIRKVVLSRGGNASTRVAEALATFDIDVVWS